MMANRAFSQDPKEVVKKAEVDKALDLYFLANSILINVDSLARFGAMLANNGVNPSSGERILKNEIV